MKIKNKTQAAKRLKFILDGYIRGVQLMTRHYYINYMNDSDIAEWTDEEIENGDGYFDILSIGTHYANQIHVTKIGYISNLLELPVSIEKWSYNEYKYEISINYRGYKFFDLCTTEEYEAERHLFYRGGNKNEIIGIGI